MIPLCSLRSVLLSYVLLVVFDASASFFLCNVPDDFSFGGKDDDAVFCVPALILAGSLAGCDNLPCKGLG